MVTLAETDQPDARCCNMGNRWISKENNEHGNNSEIREVKPT